jgi:hypothetical protein
MRVNGLVEMVKRESKLAPNISPGEDFACPYANKTEVNC